MLDRIMSLYKPDPSPLTFPRLNNYVDHINRKRIEISTRHSLASGAETQAISLLRHIMAYVEMSDLINIPSDYDRYMNVLSFIKEDLARIIDTENNNVVRKGYFVAPSGSPCKEFILPVETSDIFKDLPLDQGWEAWKKVTPVRLVYAQTQELTFSTYLGQIKFMYDKPKYIVVTIDCVALIMQYARYLTDTPRDKQLIIQDYLYQVVMNNGILKDLQNIWFINRYIDALRNVENKSINTNSIYGYIGVEFKNVIDDINNAKKGWMQGNRKPSSIISSLRLSDGSLYNYYKTLKRNTEFVVNGSQYDWVTYLRDKNWIDLIFAVYDIIGSDNSWYNEFKAAVDRDFLRWLPTRPWESCPDPELRLQLKYAVKLLGLQHRRG